MTDTIILPTADDIIQPVIDKIIALRSNATPYLNGRKGVYWHPVLGYRGQVAKMLQRLSLLAAQHRLKTGTGTDLLDYVASEFDTVPETDKTTAQGTITLGRGSDSARPAGDYPKGTRINRAAYTTLGIQFEAAEYETLADAHIDVNSSDTVTIPIQATRPGKTGNHPLLINANSGLSNVTVPPLVDNMVVVDFQVGGGSEGPDDDFVRTFARTYSFGQYGPTAAASKLGALSATGVRHTVIYDSSALGSENIVVSDMSWGSSDRWAGMVQQAIFDNDRVGFGCKVKARRLRNRVITADVTVSLRDTNYLAETTDIDVAIRAAVRSYFDDRPDWNTWNKDSLRSAISIAHDKVYQCASANVKDASSGTAITEIYVPNFSAEQLHFFLASNAMKITYTGPS